MTGQIKALISKRQRCLAKHGKDSPLFKLLHNKVQRSVKYAKRVFYDGKVKHLRESNASKWWKDVKYLAGSSGSNRSWFYQLLDCSTTESLCGKINKFFAELTSGFVPLTTSHALAYILHTILESLDKGGCLARLFFADFRKGFDLIDHQILLRKLAQFDLHNCLLRWVACFLQGRSQFVTILPATSSPVVLNGGIPQGTTIGPLLFAVMVNDLVSSWSP